MNEVNACQARLQLGLVTVFERVYLSCKSCSSVFCSPRLPLTTTTTFFHQHLRSQIDDDDRALHDLSTDSTMTSPLLCDTAYLTTSWLELLCDLFLHVVQSQAPRGSRHIDNAPFEIYTVSQKQDTELLPITSPNVNQFSKFFHWQTQQ